MTYMQVTIDFETRGIARENFNNAARTAAKKMLEEIQTIDPRAKIAFIATDQTPHDSARQYLSPANGERK